MKRIALGGTLASGVSMLLGCSVIGDGPDVDDDFEQAKKTGKQTICHVPPGNPENKFEIDISGNAVTKHEDNHGDTPSCIVTLPPTTVLMCHINPDTGTFADIMVDSDSIPDRLAAGDTIGTCAAQLCGGS